MAVRFDEKFLDEIKSRLRPSDVIGKTVKLRRQGREYVGLSPFTKEKTPSFYVNDDKGQFFDFSSGKTGDIISFLQESERLTFVEAVERLAAEDMPLAGLVLNRVTRVAAPEISSTAARAAAVRLDDVDGHHVSADTMRVHAAIVDQSARQADVAARFVSAHPTVPVVEGPAQAADVHDLDGLRAIGRSLAGR